MATEMRVGRTWVAWVLLLNGAGILAYYATEAPRPADTATSKKEVTPPPNVLPTDTPNPAPAPEKKPRDTKRPVTSEPELPKEPKAPEPKTSRPGSDPEEPKKTPEDEPKKEPPKKPKEVTLRLPEGVNWADGDQLLLIAASNDQAGVFDELAKEVAAIKKQFAGRLVGGDVFVTSDAKLWKWSEWEASTERSEIGAAAVFAKTFDAVRAYRQVIQGKRGVGTPMKTLVIWHSFTCPEEALPEVHPIPEAIVIWSGKQPPQQRGNPALVAVFGALGVCPQGASVRRVANTVASFIPKR